MNITIREIKREDCSVIARAFADQGWDKPEEQYISYLKDQEEGRRDVLIAFADGVFAGYLTVMWTSYYPDFKRESIPEIVDLNVLEKFQRKGIASKLMDRAEELIFGRSDVAGIGVGLVEDYGKAQRMYITRGYIPDGRGISQNEKVLKRGDSITVDDDLVLYFIKKLK